MDNLFIIKIGGNVIDDAAALESFLTDFASIKDLKILVHGGGKIATKIGEQLGLQPEYINGRRITDAATIDLVTMVYGGLVNKQIVSKLQSLNSNAIGITGADGNIIPATKRLVKDVDYGFAGDVEPSLIASKTLQLFLNVGLVPVMAPLTHDGKGQMLNTNADTIASTVATSLSAAYNVRLIYCFEKKGILTDMNDENSVIHLMNKHTYMQMIYEHKVADGIIPKIDNAFAAIDNGVDEVLIGDARDIVQNCTANVTGTLIK